MDLASLAVGLVLGLLVGAIYGSVRAFRLVAARRAVAGASAGFARFGLETLPERSAADILAGRIRVVLGNVPYELPVLARKQSREWLAALDARFAHLSDALDRAADDTPRVLALLAGQSTELLAMLRSYDQAGVLPAPEYLDDVVTDAEVLRATVEVWRAANPLAATLAEVADETMASTRSAPPSTSPLPTVGDLESSTG